jgi:hypothetical protein
VKLWGDELGYVVVRELPPPGGQLQVVDLALFFVERALHLIEHAMRPTQFTKRPARFATRSVHFAVRDIAIVQQRFIIKLQLDEAVQQRLGYAAPHVRGIVLWGFQRVDNNVTGTP